LANLNQIYLLGNLTRDPELRYTNEGMAITEMGLAVNKRWKDANGDENSVVDFFNITVWNHLAENCAGSLKKGDRIMVGGHLNLRTWENKDGKKYNIVNITADVAALSLEFNKANNHETRTNGANNHEARANSANSYDGGPEGTNSGEGSDKKDSGEGRPTKENIGNGMDGVNDSNGTDRTNNHENRVDRTNINESLPYRLNSDITRMDKMDSGGSRQYTKNKKKEPEKKQDSASIAQGMASDYSLEVISK
jgi:single-strand DNA-binding protein